MAAGPGEEPLVELALGEVAEIGVATLVFYGMRNDGHIRCLSRPLATQTARDA